MASMSTPTERLPITARRTSRRTPHRAPGKGIAMLVVVALIAAGIGYAWTSGMAASWTDAISARVSSLTERVSLPTSRSDDARVAYLIDSDVNVRADASLEAEILRTVSLGDQVTVRGAQVGDFLPVRVDGRDGWIAAVYLDSSAPTSEIIAEAPEPADDAPSIAVVAETPTTAPIAGEVIPDETPTPEPEPTAIPTEIPVEPTAPPASETQAEMVVVDEVASVADDPEVVAEPGEHWIDVNRTTQTVTLYIGTEAQASFTAKIGRDPAVDGFYSTAVGTFHVYSKEKGLASTPFVDDTYMTDWVGFDPDRKNGFHSPVREADGSERVPQNPTTMGCVRLTAEDAVTVFDFAYVGMRVEVHD